MKDITEQDREYTKQNHLTPLIENLLDSSGFNPSLMGYSYIVKAVEIYISNRFTLSHPKTKLIYPQIAKQYSTSAQNVERNIRTAIKNAWKQNGGNYFYLRVGCFKYGIKRPTCGELIDLIVQYIEKF